MSKLRQARIESAIKREVSKYLLELDDSRLRGITITYVDLSSDLHYAKIYFTAINNEDRSQEILDTLSHASKRIQKDIAHRLKSMRHVPLISFHFDLSIQKGDEVINILNKIKEELQNKEEQNNEKPPTN
ncbi:MAG: 30S ribosome-binding factor RbfA [Caldisericota bacterium]|nr:30S ribosome-binding factor RbfA [Caldisericota bacterium]